MFRTLSGLIVTLLLACCVVAPTWAQTCNSPAQQLSICQAALAQLDAGTGNTGYYARTFYCGFRPGWGTSNYWILNKATNEILAGPYGGTQCAGAGNDICKARPSYNTSFAGNLNVCAAGCTYKPGPTQEKWTVRGITGGVTKGGGGRMSPTGETCGNGPLNPPDPNPVDQPIPKLCGGGSCHDTASGKFCAVGGDGTQVCVPDKPGKDGACMSSGDTTLCVGSPAPKPPNPPISDPATQIASSDKYTSQSGDGPISDTTVNNYNNTGSGANPGKGAGDTDGKGDKPDDQKKDDGTTASGGGDCTTAPMVEGSQALGMIARQDWLLRCQLPEWAKDPGDGDKYNVSDTPRGSVFKSEGAGLEKVDQTSWAGNSCPALPTPMVMGKPFITDADFFCKYLALVRAVVMLAGAVAAAVILAAGSRT